jgi:hypothetical protein
MALAGELSVVRERLDTVERILAAKGAFSADEIESFRPDEKCTAERDRWREEYLERILRIVHHDLESVERGEAPGSYQKVVEKVSS